MEPTTSAPTAPEQSPDQLLTKAQITAAATNSPALSPDSIRFAGREFKVVYLDYDRQLQFLSLIQPLMTAMVSKVASKAAAKSGVKVPGIELVPDGVTGMSGLIKFCASDLPELVRLTISMTDESITKEWIKKNADSPFELASIVVKQIEKNNMIQKFLDFFVSALPAMMGMQKLFTTA